MIFLNSGFITWSLLCLTGANGLLDQSGCGTTKSCIQIPYGCNARDVPCVFFTYAMDSAKNFYIELSGAGANEYVAVGFTEETTMRDADLYYCGSNGSAVELATGTIRSFGQPPHIDVALRSDLTDVDRVLSNGIAECKFKRPASITKAVSGGKLVTFDLSSSSFTVLLAKGPRLGLGQIGKHSAADRGKTNGKVDFTVIRPNDADDPAKQAVATQSGAQSDTLSDNCGKTLGCFQNPDNCSPGSSGCRFLSWQYNPSTLLLDFTMVAGSTSDYLSFAFAPAQMMKDADMYYCLPDAGGAKFGSAVIDTERSMPNDLTVDPATITNVATKVENGAVTCSFTRAASVTKSISSGPHDFDLSARNYFILYAVGAPSGGFVTYHTARGFSSALINFTQATSAGGGGGADTTKLVKAHACLMMISWITCVSIGVLVARHFKPLWHDKTICGLKVWFQLHRAVMVFALICTLIAFILIFVAVGGYSDNAGAHPILGIIVTILCVVNPVMALFRPHPGTPKRPIFNWAHFGVGSAARVIAVATIFLGVNQARLDLDDSDTWILVGWVIFHVITELLLEFISAYYGHIAGYKKTRTSTTSLEPTAAPAGNDADPPPKGTTLKYAVLAVYCVGNIVCLGLLIDLVVKF